MNLPSVSPLVLEILMHYHVSGAPFPRKEAPACFEAIEWLAGEGLIRSDSGPSGYKLTKRGRKWLEKILATPLPKLHPDTWRTVRLEIALREAEEKIALYTGNGETDFRNKLRMVLGMELV